MQLSQSDIIEFARQFDPQPMHLDPNAASFTIYGGLIASGWHTGALFMGLLVRNLIAQTTSMGSPGMDDILRGGLPAHCLYMLTGLPGSGKTTLSMQFLLEGAKVEDANSVGEGHLKLVLRVGNARLGAFGWDMASELSRIGARVSVIGSLRPDTYRGGENVELKIERVI